MDLTAWTEMEVFRRMPRGGNDKVKEERDKKAMEIREKWLSKNYFFGHNTPGSKSAVRKVSINSRTCGQLTIYFGNVRLIFDKGVRKIACSL